PADRRTQSGAEACQHVAWHGGDAPGRPSVVRPVLLEVSDGLLRALAEQLRQPREHGCAPQSWILGHVYLGQERKQNTSRSVARGVVERHTDRRSVGQTQAAESVFAPEWLVIHNVHLDRRLASPRLD